MKYGFVILHYLTDEDTMECIKSIIEKCKGKMYYIVVVDNYSNNGSIERIEEQVKRNENIYILKNKENLGFAKGNNIGYEFCKKELNCNCIIISNNDIIIETPDMFEKIKDDIEKYNCAIIGPDIESLTDQGHQNPMNEQAINKKIVVKNIIKYKLLHFLSVIHVYDFLKRFLRKEKKQNQIQNKIEGILENVQLHGAFLIFTENYIKEMDYAFSDQTFLYLEETILKRICDKNQLKTLYDSKIKVYHKEDSSTNKMNPDNNQKRIFVFKNMIKSYKALMKYI